MYTEAHRTLLTYIRSVKSLKLQNLLDAFVLICQRLEVEDEHTMESLNQYIADINIQISQQGFKIERKNDEVDGSLHFIFINTIVDEIMKESSMYTTSELVSIKGIIDDIIEASNFEFSTSRATAQQIVHAHQAKGLKEAAAFVDRLIDDGWFDATLNDRLILSVKSLCELKQYLIDGYGSGENDDEDGGGSYSFVDNVRKLLPWVYLHRRKMRFIENAMKCIVKIVAYLIESQV